MRKQFILLFLFFSGIVSAENYRVASPDGRIAVEITTGQETLYKVDFNGKQILASSPLSMRFGDGRTIGHRMKVRKVVKNFVDREIEPVVRQKCARLQECYNELILKDKEYSLSFRVFNDGLAYRFHTDFTKPQKVVAEEVVYRFPEDFATLFPEEKDMVSAQQRLYLPLSLSQIDSGRFCSTPMIVKADSTVRLFISESNLCSYPGMFLQKQEQETALYGYFAPYVLEEEDNGDRAYAPVKRADYLAQTQGKRDYPWRLMIVADDDKELLESQLVYLLGEPAPKADFSWIRPGKIAWDWWNALALYGVDFKAGINMDTYKYYIDFASRYGIEYVVLDDGWSEAWDVTKVVPDLDMKALVDYATQKKVGVMLWVAWAPFEKKMDEAFTLFSEWGVKGLKVDFMDRDDQRVVDFYYTVANKALKYKMLVDFHGSYKPTGWSRTFPHVLTSEGVAGLEQCKWSEVTQPTHNLNLPFIRMVAGPMDYTPGGMNNYHSKDFKIWFNTPATIGTRCHQLGMYVVYESPLQMLADSPSNYYWEEECMEFLSEVPTVWDETRILEGRIGEYAVVARRKGDVWFLGGMTGSQRQTFEITLDFIEGNRKLISWEDGVNVAVQARDYAKRIRDVKKGDTITLRMYEGGGYVGIIR